ncbi:hypothetical protein I7I50_00715 [Histoplasma capsulatum G186AR]|uniref:Uncharacterized protein n=1 Tax=Ajellomyces capsulatus TaxID=5037 RepID=A0A8H7YG40_AJECA|nr:hypothetical protein I7I52_07983 [Histoplasma capsulatum]QSS72769.1 hypothetical protein I7I50_00715 [Histoplasma capsulatum G186AR]
MHEHYQGSFTQENLVGFTYKLVAADTVQYLIQNERSHSMPVFTRHENSRLFLWNKNMSFIFGFASIFILHATAASFNNHIVVSDRGLSADFGSVWPWLNR